ncbi:hypothetical protein B0J13DRAFT_182073 [Dactylonectria estremocensis]|uniref:Uncharacterized protein n=1 Tax=Dactylonectria estremocensis TaxID=1079267 RepID=A0A9P9JF22_9HYPO|nr:hypothetical protein B0J13DRAFT_182073 [Dactylonectria estremocensis]
MTKPERSDGKSIGCFRTMHALVRRRYIHAWRSSINSISLFAVQQQKTLKRWATNSPDFHRVSPDFKKALASLVWPPRPWLHLHTPTLQLARFTDRTHSHRHSSGTCCRPGTRPSRAWMHSPGLHGGNEGSATCNNMQLQLQGAPRCAPQRRLVTYSRSRVWLLFAGFGCYSTVVVSTLALMRRRILF